MNPALAPPPRGLTRFAWPFVLLLAGLALTFGSWAQERHDRQERLRATLETRSRAAQNLIQVRLRYYEQALLGTRGLFTAKEGTGSKEFAAYIANLRVEETYPGIQGIGFAKLVPAADKERHQALVRSHGFPEYQMRPEQNQAVYSTILHLEPFKNRNLRAFGYDMLTEPVRQEAMARARDEDRTTLSGRVRLVQETDTEVQPGVLVYVPVYTAKHPSLTLEDRRQHLVGWVYAPLRMHDLMNGLLGEAESDLALQVYDGPGSSPEALLFDRGSALAAATGSTLRAQHTVAFGGRTWTLATQPLPSMLAHQGRDVARTILAIGGLASLLAAAFAFFLMEQFRHLRLSNESLQVRGAERDEAREQARASELNYLTLSNTGEALIWTSGTDKLCNYFNLPWLAFTGRTLKQELGNGWAEGVHPEDLARCLDVYVRAFDQQESFSMDYRLRHTSGDYRWIIDTGTPRYDTQGVFLGYIGHCLDISEQRRTLDALRVSEEKYRALVETSQELIWRCDSEGRFTYLNPAWEMTHGYRVADMLGRRFSDFQSAAAAAQDAREYAARMDGGAFRNYETTHLTRDGQEVALVFNAVPTLDPEGTPTGMQGTATDITHRKRAEEQARQREAQDAQSQKLESLGVLAGGVAHDMNNVLTAILGLASATLQSQPKGSLAHLALDAISKAAVRGGKMVKALLNFARTSPIETQDVDMNELLREEVRLLIHSTLAKVQLELDLAADLRPIQGDAAALTHAVMNLCINAVEAMPENGNLTLRTRNVDNQWIEVCVEDSGCGMAKETLTKALDPFFTTKGGGNGLGLSLVHSSVKAHRGQLELFSEPGEGTRVRMRFPACEPALRVAKPGPAALDARPGKALHVLVVDDDDMAQLALETILTTLEHAHTSVPCGEEALALLQTGFAPDLVILDMNMPGLGGTGTLPRLRALHPDLPVLLVTGRADQAAINLAAAHPHVTLLAKPFSLEDLRKHL